MANVEDILSDRRVCICAGSGGVGKTTTSAALAAGLAARGQKVAVLTIDPAKRLADSLGLEELGNEPRQVDPALFERAGIEMEGELWAMMLDAKATFDELVRKHAPDEETRDRILQNRIYRQISNALAGSQEYMAMEKLFEIHQEGRFDFLVLDTPPSRNALDFLDAPKRLTQFIEGRGMQMFMKPTGLATKVVGRGSSMAFGVLRRVVGIDLLADLGEFFQAFSGMVDGFRERATARQRAARRPLDLLHDRLRPPGRADRGGRLLPPQAGRGEAAGRRRDREQGPLRERGRPLGERGRPTSCASLLDDDLAERVASNFRDYQALAKRDAANVEHLARELNAKQVIRVPYMDEDVHDLGGLLKINRYLFASEREREAMATGRAA